MVFEVTLFIFLILLSALFSSSETAFFSSNHRFFEELSEEGNHAAIRVLTLLDRPRRLLIAILIGNTFVNISLGVLSASIAHRFASGYNLPEYWIILIEVVTVTFTILIFGEILPKIIAIRTASHYALMVSGIISLFYKLLSPITQLFYKMTTSVTTLFQVEKEPLFNSEEDFFTLVELGEQKGAIHRKEKDIITSLMKFSDTSLREIMIPRPDMVAIDIDSSPADIIRLISDQRFSRIPAYKNDLDTIVGFIFAKDVLEYYDEKSPDFDIQKIIRPPLFAPENKSVSNMLKEFQIRKTKIAVVVDEYGGTSGIVTVEDVLEEILGDIQDEMDENESPLNWISPNEVLVDAGINVEDLHEVLKLEFPEDRSYDTLAGFVMDSLGKIPNLREKVLWRHHEFIVYRMEKRRIVTILIRVLGDET